MSKLETYLGHHKIRQADFADVLGVSQATVSRLAKGIMLPSLELAVAIERLTAGAVPATSWVPEPTTMPIDQTADGSASAAPGENSQSKDAA